MVNESDKWAKTREYLNMTNGAEPLNALDATASFNAAARRLDEVDASEAEHAQLDVLEDDETERVAQQLKQLRDEYAWIGELQNVWEAIDDLR